MEPLLTNLLGLPGVDVESYQESANQLILQVEVHEEEATCPRCGYVSHRLHQNHDYLARDLDISGRQVWLKVNRRQFKCQPCGKPFSEALDFIGERRKYTNRLAEAIVKQVVHSSTRNVALNHNLSEDIVWSMVDYVSQKKNSKSS